MIIRSKHRPQHRLGWIDEIRHALRHRTPDNDQPQEEPTPVAEPVEHTGATEAWSPAAELAMVGEGVLDHHPAPPAMGTAEDEDWWRSRFAEIERGFRAELDTFTVTDNAANYADVGDIFDASYIAAVAQAAWVEHDTRELVFEPIERAVPNTRPPGKAARRRYHDQRRLIGATA